MGGLNLYGFAGGDPVNFSDPFGLCTEADGWKDCDRMISKEQGFQILQKAAKSGEWSYTQDPNEVNYGARSGDCTDYSRNAVQEGLGAGWAGGPEANTAAF